MLKLSDIFLICHKFLWVKLFYRDIHSVHISVIYINNFFRCQQKIYSIYHINSWLESTCLACNRNAFKNFRYKIIIIITWRKKYELIERHCLTRWVWDIIFPGWCFSISAIRHRHVNTQFMIGKNFGNLAKLLIV